jgi:hypothetical protein
MYMIQGRSVAETQFLFSNPLLQKCGLRINIYAKLVAYGRVVLDELVGPK